MSIPDTGAAEPVESIKKPGPTGKGITARLGLVRVRLGANVPVTAGHADAYLEREVSASCGSVWKPVEKVLSRENLALSLCGVEGQASLCH